MKPFSQNRAIYLFDLNRIIQQFECDQFSFCITGYRPENRGGRHHASAPVQHHAGAIALMAAYERGYRIRPAGTHPQRTQK
nr:MAG TPA_asm: hypothetical protein [Caudoviricetes sp.]